jgi:hypothetical protein
MSQSPLFELADLAGRLVLENVYLNGLHALRRLEIRNTSRHRLLVKLRSNLGSQIAFQLTNENLPDTDSTSEAAYPPKSGDDAKNGVVLPSAPGLLINVATNTVAAAAIAAFGNATNCHQFNELFNYVNHIDEVEIPARCSQKVIIAFLPDARSKRSPSGRSMGTSTPDNEGSFSTSTNEEESHDFFEVNGLLFFFAYILDKEQNVLATTEQDRGSVPLSSPFVTPPHLHV